MTEISAAQKCMSSQTDSLAVALFSEILTVDQLARNNVAKALPRGMVLSHFSVLNHLARTQSERSPAQLARTFHLTRGAMTNTLRKLETSGYIHIRPDWDDARRKMVTISPAGRSARDAALAAIAPIIADAVDQIGVDKVRAILPVLRDLRIQLSESE
ncbi:MarR family protein [Pseudooctadecabacter jejudonensis]|uniref:MarR family protein n=2 Tax=Pseudooctadecabacter jejudonensis TaxID=1391910 RepID=A0A1Y5S967_9RHOB|nr:MarR family protein [Pseudooctadecabacter jejudonensis]